MTIPAVMFIEIALDMFKKAPADGIESELKEFSNARKSAQRGSFPRGLFGC
jgi:hypothetical protein